MATLKVYTTKGQPTAKKTKPKNISREVSVPSQEDFQKKVIRYGDDDNFPLRLARLVQNSPTASSCISTKADFIEGAGFSNEKIADLPANTRGIKFGDIHSQVSDSFAMFEGFALNIKYSATQDISEIYFIPFENCRFAKPDSKGVINQIKVNPYYGTAQFRNTEEYTKVFDTYNPDKNVIKLQQNRDLKKYKGQIIYVGTTSPLSRFYPNPKYYSANHWMKIDEAIGGFHEHNIENGFFQSVLLRMLGDENAPSTHPDDMKWDATANQYVPDPKITMGMRMNIEMQKFSGWEKAGNIMVLWAKMKEAFPEIQSFPTTVNAELFKVLSSLTTEIIARATNVPAILANIESGATLGGDGNQIRASVKLMQQRVIKLQAVLERVYMDLLSRMVTPFNEKVKIVHYNPFPELEKVDPLIWAALSLDEQRQWIKDNTEYVLFDKPAAVTPATQPAPATNVFKDVFFAEYPEGAKASCKKARDFYEQTGSKCGGKNGWEWNQDIIDGKPLSFKMIKRIHNFLLKKQGFKDGIFSESCESLLYSAWGGTDMLNWAADKIKSINE